MKTLNELDSIDDFINNSKPMINTIGKEEQKIEQDFMKSIIDEKLKFKNSPFMDMVGTLTEVEYYHIVELSRAKNYGVNTNPITDISVDTKKFKKIKNFKVKFNSNINLENELDDNVKSFITTGSITILPRTIKPYEGDMFIMEYMGKKYTYRINSVEIKTVETDSGFECQFALHEENFKIDKRAIMEEYEFHNELVGTTYRPLLTVKEHDQLLKIRLLYKHIGEIFTTLFYDKKLNVYSLRNYNFKKLNTDCNYEIKNNTYINTGKVEDNYPYKVPEDWIFQRNSPESCEGNVVVSSPLISNGEVVYDNYLNYFIKTNLIFTESHGKLIKNDCVLGLDRKAYLRSIFNVILSRSEKQYMNTLLSPSLISYGSQGINPTLVGIYNVMHLDGIINDCYDLLSPSLITNLKDIKSYNSDKRFDQIIYKSYTKLIEDTIIRYVQMKTDDFVDRFIHLYEYKDELFEHVVEPNDIYYLYPILGYIIEKTLADKFKDNVLL